MRLKYTIYFLFAIMSVAIFSGCANAGGVAQQMHQQSAPAMPMPQQQYYPQDNDSDYRLPGQYSPTLNDLRRQYPAQPVPQTNQYYDQYNDNNASPHGHETYYYQ